MNFFHNQCTIPPLPKLICLFWQYSLNMWGNQVKFSPCKDIQFITTVTYKFCLIHKNVNCFHKQNSILSLKNNFTNCLLDGLGRRERLPTPVFWPGEFHGLYSPWGCKESDTAEWLSLGSPTTTEFKFIYTFFGFLNREMQNLLQAVLWELNNYNEN